MVRRLPAALAAAALLAGAAPPAAPPPPAAPAAPPPTPLAPWAAPVPTFSIVGYDPETGEVGGAIQSRDFTTGGGELWAKGGIGVVATQAIPRVTYGPWALDLLRGGMRPADVVATVWARDPDPEPEAWSKHARQFAVMDAGGRVAAFTGPRAPAWAGHRQGRHCSAQGSALSAARVVDSMVVAFERTRGRHLSFRLLAALEAGHRIGGDRAPVQSVAMVVVRKGAGVRPDDDTVLRLQVDDHPQAVAELRRLVERAGEEREERRSR